MIVFYTAWVIVAVVFVAVSIFKRQKVVKIHPSSDAAIEVACDADKPSHEREVFDAETLQHLYGNYSSDNQSLSEADRHVDKLYKMLGSDSLDIEGRLFVWNEIWSIKHATNFVRG